MLFKFAFLKVGVVAVVSCVILFFQFINFIFLIETFVINKQINLVYLFQVCVFQLYTFIAIV